MYSPLKNNDGVVLAPTLWEQDGQIYISVDGEQTPIDGNYNDFCPFLSKNSSTRSVTGCTNTADAQIIYYWLLRGYDLTLQVDENDYFLLNTSNNRKYYLSETANCGEGTISELNEILSDGSNYSTGEFIAALNFYCGVKNHSSYGRSTSTIVSMATLSDGLTNLKAYRAAGFDSYFSVGETNSDFFVRKTIDGYTNNLLTELAYSIIRENLDYGEIVRVDIPMHSIFLDGYRFNKETQSYEYHLNYGWGVDYEGSKWYTEREMFMEDVDVLGLDLSPDIHVVVSCASSEYWGGSFLRGVERINHIQTSKTSRFEFSEDVRDAEIILENSVAFTSDVKLLFKQWNIDLCVNDKSAVTSAQSMYFSDMTGSVILNSQKAVYAVGLSGTGCIEMTLDGGLIFAGASQYSNSQLMTYLVQRNDDLSFLQDIILVDALFAGDENDSLDLKNNAFVAGNLFLGGGENSLSVQTGSVFYGNVSEASGELDVTISVSGEYADNPCIVLQGSSEMFREQTNNILNISVSDAADEVTYWLLQTETAEELFYFDIHVTCGEENFVLNKDHSVYSNFSLVYADNTLGIVQREKLPVIFLANGEIVESGDTNYSDREISSDGEWDEVQVNLHGNVSGFRIGAGGVMTLADGGQAESTSISDGGTVAVSNGGILIDTRLNSSGILNVYSGGIIQGGLHIDDGGVVSAYTGAEVRWELSDGEVAGFINNISLINGTPDYFISIEGDLEYGDYVLAQNADGFNCVVTLADNSGRNFSLSVGSSFTVNAHTYLLDNSTGELLLSIESAFIPEPPAPVLVYSSGILVKSSGQISGAELRQGRENEITVFSGGVVQNTDVYEQGSIVLYDGGCAESTNVYSGGALHVYSGAVASSQTIYRNGYLGIGSGAEAYGTVLSGGELTVWDDGAVFDNLIGEYSQLILSGGAVASSSIVSSGGALHVYSGAVASAQTIYNSGYFGVGSGAMAYETVLDGGRLIVWDGGIVSVNTIEENSHLILSCGAVASSSIISSGGALHVYSGAVASAQTVYSSGYLGVGSGAKIWDTEITDCSQLKVWAGGVIQDSFSELCGSIILSSGALANNTTVGDSGFLHIYDEANASGVNIQDDGYVGVGNGALISDVKMEGNGSLVFYDGAVLSGENSFAGEVAVAQEGEIDVTQASIIFDLQEMSPNENGVIEDFSYFEEAKSFAVDVTGMISGKFILADEVDEFDFELKIFDEGNLLGVIEIGDSFMYNSGYCSLSIKNKELVFSVVQKQIVTP